MGTYKYSNIPLFRIHMFTSIILKIYSFLYNKIYVFIVLVTLIYNIYTYVAMWN